MADPLDVELVELHLRQLCHPDGSLDRYEVVLRAPMSKSEFNALGREVGAPAGQSFVVKGKDAADHACAFLPDHLMGLLLEDT